MDKMISRHYRDGNINTGNERAIAETLVWRIPVHTILVDVWVAIIGIQPAQYIATNTDNRRRETEENENCARVPAFVVKGKPSESTSHGTGAVSTGNAHAIHQILIGQRSDCRKQSQSHLRPTITQFIAYHHNNNDGKGSYVRKYYDSVITNKCTYVRSFNSACSGEGPAMHSVA
jgi:hypothetical protein